MENIPNNQPDVPKDTDVRAKLQADAEAADRGEQGSPLETPVSVEQTDDTPGNDEEAHASDSKESKERNPDSSADPADETETDAERAERERDDKGRFKKPDGAKPEANKPQDRPTETRPESNYQRAQKDADRRDRSWKALEAEKAEVRAQAANMERRMNELEQRASQPTQQQAPQFSSREYAQASQEFERQASRLMDEGDIDGAKEQLDLANKSRAASQQYAQQEYGQQTRQFEQTWSRNAEAVLQKFPELQDGNTEESKSLVQLLQNEPILSHVADGFEKAVKMLGLQRDAADASGLRETNAKQTKEIERLQGLLDPQGNGQGARQPSSKSFENMTTAEQKLYLERRAEEADMVA